MAEHDEGDAPDAASESPAWHAPSATQFGIVGPSGSGKTLLALALGAAWPPRPEDIGLKVRSNFDIEYDVLATNIPAAMMRLGPSPDTVSRFQIDVELPARRRALVERLQRFLWERRQTVVSLFQAEATTVSVAARVELIDGPGDVLFPANRLAPTPYYCGAKLCGLIDSAQALIICVNAARPQRDVVAAGISALVSRATQSDGLLPYRAVLIALTHVDVAVDTFMASVRNLPAADETLARVSGKTASTSLGFRLHAPAMARWLVGEAAVHRIWSHLARGAKLGFGVVCAPGFDASLSGPWAPVGLEETLYFLLNGESARDRQIGTIVEFAKDDRLMLPVSSAHEVPLGRSA